jgi:putative two-component system response regulator
METAWPLQRSLAALEGLVAEELRHHEEGVGRLVVGLAGLLGLEPGLAEALRYAATLHDVGKLALPLELLRKAAPLTPADWELLRSHTVKGEAILRAASVRGTDLAASVARHHHECWDGSGYPDGLRGEAIPREARIVAVCDVYAALREQRAYKRGMEHDEAIRTILGGAGGDARVRPGNFDPLVLAAFAAGHDALRRAYEEVRAS